MTAFFLRPHQKEAAVALSRPIPSLLPPPHLPPKTPTTNNNSADVLYDGPNGAWSPALTVSKLCLTLRSMLASNADKRRPPGDADYCRRVGTRSPKLTQWRFDDDSV